MKEKGKFNLNGLIFYKLQFTSFFSIVQRIAAFLIFCVIFYYFLTNFILGSFAFFVNPIKLNSLNLLVFILFLFFFVCHFVNGMRIFFISSLFFKSFSKRLVNFDSSTLLYVLDFYFAKLRGNGKSLGLSLREVTLFKKILLNYIRFEEAFKFFFIKTRLMFLVFIFGVYSLFIIGFLY